MPTPAGLARLRALELLKDGDWHEYGTVLREIAAAVPPGVAVRRAERMRLLSNRGTPSEDMPRKKDVGNTTRLIAVGSTSIARDVLADRRSFEIEPRGTRLYDGPKKVRLLPARLPNGGGEPDGQQMGHGLRS